MMPYKQLSLAEIFENCQNKFDRQKNQLLELLENIIDLDEIVPPSFIMHFHAATGRPRKHQLYPMIWALIPILKDFFQKHPLINPKIFLGDAAFDSIEIYKYLLQETSF